MSVIVPMETPLTPAPPVWRRLLAPLATGAGYYLGAELGVAASSLSEGIALFWLPNGVLLAALLLLPRREWALPLIMAVLAEVAADLPTFTLGQALGFAAVNVFECLLAATLLNRVARPFTLDRLRHVVLFGLFALVVACGLAALLGALVYSMTTPSAMSFWAFWMIWWLGDGLGVLVVTPLLLGWLHGRDAPMNGRYLEAVLLFLITLAMCVWVFSQSANVTERFPSSPFLLLPLSLWAAVRFGIRGAASIGLLIAAMAVVATLFDQGPFIAPTPGGTALLLQQTLAALIFSSLALAALLQELRDRTVHLRIRDRAIEAISDGVMIIDARTPDLPVVFANAAMRQTGEHSVADRVLRSCGLQPDLAEDGAELAAMCHELGRGQPARAMLHEVLLDGSESWNELRIAPVRDESGELTHYVAIQHDLSDVKRNEAELRATHDALDLLNRDLEARVEARTDELQRLNRRLEELASIDPLTGASNRRHFLDLAKAEINRARRQHLPLSVVMVDIDFFKTVNDRFGHEAGDRVLVALATTIRGALRGSDVFARLGGEEFILMLPGQGLDAAALLAERLRLLIGGMKVPVSGHEVEVTVSLGVATLEKDTDGIDDLLRHADQALYLAKNQGRNRVCLAPPPAPPIRLPGL